MTTKYYRLAHFNMAANSSEDVFVPVANHMNGDQWTLQSLGDHPSKIQFLAMLFCSVGTNTSIPDMAPISDERETVGDAESVKKWWGHRPRLKTTGPSLLWSTY
eukprot:UN05385